MPVDYNGSWINKHGKEFPVEYQDVHDYDAVMKHLPNSVTKKLKNMDTDAQYDYIMDNMFDRGWIRKKVGDAKGINYETGKLTPQIRGILEDNLAQGKEVTLDFAGDNWMKVDPSRYANGGIEEAIKTAELSSPKILPQILKGFGLLALPINILMMLNDLGKPTAASSPRDWAMAQGPAPLRPSFIKDDIQGTLNAH